MVVFGCKKSGTSRGYGVREISLATLEREGGHFFRACFARLSKVVVLVAKTVAPVRGIEKGKLLSLRSRERESLFRACFARLSKVVVFLAKINALVGVSKGLVGPRSLRSRGPIKKEECRIST